MLIQIVNKKPKDKTMKAFIVQKVIYNKHQTTHKYFPRQKHNKNSVFTWKQRRLMVRFGDIACNSGCAINAL